MRRKDVGVGGLEEGNELVQEVETGEQNKKSTVGQSEKRLRP